MDFLEDTFDEIIKIFQVESEEIISRINNSLLSLEKNPNDKDAVLTLFRDAHSLKGASRMVGFNNVQTIAHKIEDILGLAKENKITLNKKVVDVLYKTTDFLAELIQKSIDRKKEVTDDISAQLTMLKNIENNSFEEENLGFTVIKSDFDVNLLVKNIENINNIIAESLVILMKMEEENDEELIDKLSFQIKNLYQIFSKIGYFELKKVAEDINVKLEFICKASHSLTDQEKEKIRESIDEIIDRLIPICKENNLETVDYYSLAFEKNSKKNRQEQAPIKKVKNEELVIDAEQAKISELLESLGVVETPEVVEGFGEGGPFVCHPEDLSCILTKFDDIKSEDSLAEIKDFLTNFEKKCINENIRIIIKNILNIFDFVEKNQIELDEDAVFILKQSIEYCDNTIKDGGETADKDLVLQQLEIVQRILEFNNEKTEEVAYAVKSKKMADFSAIFETGEIKTLRVDSEKLDKLVNQVGDLIITKIKTKKHLHELNLINKNLEEYQRNSIKVLTYLKYYNKKNIQVENNETTNSFLVKQLLSLFGENNRKFQEAVSDISSLQRAIQEDDTKMNFIIDDLEGMVKKIRVLPLATVFHLFGRMVRDIAREKNKEIELEIVGSETSTDKKIIEEIKTPLIHIIRNAIDHGIETPDERVALGKKPVGKIMLRASQVDNNVIIEIIDDGRGVNIQKIREKAVRKGYLTEQEADSMTDEQITNIIFSPGFSTEEQITSISGRGIGLDVVQTKISQLNGKVKIISEVNKGCCIQIILPTTMSTLKAFLVNSSGQTFAVPMSVIKTVLRKKKEEILLSRGSHSIILDEKTVPLYYLKNILNLPESNLDSDKETILIIESDNKTIALVVDKLIGDQEILHKKLSAPLYRLKNISGMTTLMSGEICLILNVSDIMKSVASIYKISSKSSEIRSSKKSSDFKVLVVDDSKTTRTLGKNILTKAGYQVGVAEDPLEAFEIMKNTSFDLIISDIEMPGMNGFDFLKKLKTDEMFYDIPVIMVTSVESEEHRKLARDLGAIKYILKNEFNQKEFKEMVDEILLY